MYSLAKFIAAYRGVDPEGSMASILDVSADLSVVKGTSTTMLSQS